MKLIDFLKKETPSYGGCMVCLSTYNDDYQERTVYLLVERVETKTGDMFTINGRLFYDYNYAWDYKVKDWEILYKKEA